MANARKATDEFVAWLEKLAPTKTGPSGVGKENYTWYQQNVHFIPYNWDEEVVLLRRELERAQASPCASRSTTIASCLHLSPPLMRLHSTR